MRQERQYFRQDDPATAVILIISGYVKVLRIAPNGDETLIAIRTDGEALIEPCTEPTGFYGVSAKSIGQPDACKNTGDAICPLPARLCIFESGSYERR